MSRFDSHMQEKFMSLLYRGKETFKPLNTGRIDEHVSCIREYIANIFFYTKNDTTIMIDAGYNYERLKEKMSWLDLDPKNIKHILITHQDTDHVGAIEDDSDLLFKDARIYIGETENRYLTGEVRRKVVFHKMKLNQLRISNPKTVVRNDEVFYIDDIKVEAIFVPGHTWGHIDYLIDDSYLFTGDSIWFGADGGYSFIDALAEDNDLALKSLEKLENLLKERNLHPLIITGHTGFTDDRDFAFAHRDKICKGLGKKIPHDPKAPYDGYDERDDTEENARNTILTKHNS